MVQIVGKYRYVSSENFEDYIKNLGKSENFEDYMKNLGKSEFVNIYLQITPIEVEIEQNGDQWVIVTVSQDKTSTIFTITTTFNLGEVYNEQFPTSDLIFESVTTKERNGLRTETTLSTGITAIRNYEFTDTEMIVHLSSNKSDVQAKRIYKRV
ncbi:PREDICTED: fatty acid-binding protein 1-like [Acromyrmex echinatior]|uniref:fatty acid-binding protein 1-like n=1 Tax=Acromyrmex echinatior TaxID=103372 RepID=UPI000580E4A0|nr:PREDICTED: fatty acid-binding protein 1-like [Acromyrmex echinatior]